MNKQIEEFVNKRPKVEAAYGYGSGVFKQAGYTAKDKPQIDLILIVDDIKKWHKENIKLNKKDYSLTGKIFFNLAKYNKIKGNTGIAYVSNIKENGSIFKYGTIEKKDFINSLNTWSSFYLAGRFQKTIYPIIETDEMKELIDTNRNKALLLASFLVDDTITTKKDLLVTLCGLSYLGDTRMKFAENPHKVLNIVEGSFDSFNKIYKFDKDYLSLENEKVIIDKTLLKDKLLELPEGLLEYIKDYLNEDDSIIKEKIIEYFTILNKKESSAQTLKGLSTNGLFRSVSYASKKVLKRFKH